MRRHVLLLAVAVALVTAGCGSDDQPAMEGPFPQITTTTSTTVQATPPPTGGPALKLPTPKDAANHLYEAWKAGDRAKALQAATQRAVDALFSRPFNAASFRGCDEPDQLGADCSYRYEGGGLVIHVVGDATEGFFAETAEFLAD